MSSNATLLAGRVLIAFLFLFAGYQALSDISGSAGYLAGLGLPLPVFAAWGVGLFEAVGGLLILAGWQTRRAALALAAFTLAASFLGQYGQGGDDPLLRFMHQQAFMKDIAVAGGLLSLAVVGAGAYSLDAWRTTV